MNDAFVECLVAQQPGRGKLFLRTLLFMLTAAFLVLGLFLTPLAWLIAIACGVGGYILNRFCFLEFEYLYINKQVSVDRIVNQSSRKTVLDFSLEKLEIFAPVSSWHLDEYKNRQLTTVNYSEGDEKTPGCFVMIGDGRRILLTPDAAFINALKNVAPRKVFTD